MFDFAWSEIALIGVVALVLIGPKDMPVAIRTISALVKKARRMAAEFQTHVDDMVKDTDLKDVRDQIREIRNLDIRGTIARAVDSDGSIRQAMAEPLVPPPPAVPFGDAPPAVEAPAIDTLAVSVAERPPHSLIAAEPPGLALAPAFVAPAFIPPAIAHPRPMPAFIPPETAQTPSF